MPARSSAAFVVASLLLGAAAAPAKPSALGELRASTAAILERRCEGCHVSGDPNVQEKALAVFDLRNKQWAVQLGSRREKVPGRMKSKGTPEELTTIRAWLAAEAASR